MCDMLILGIAAWVFLTMLALAIAVIVAVEKEEPWGAFVAILAAGALAHFSGTVNMVNVLHDWKQLIVFLGAYLAIGVAWCVIKWVFYTNEWAREQHNIIRSNRQKFLKNLNLEGDSIPSEHKAAWEFWIKDGKHGDWSNAYSPLSRFSPEKLESSDAISVANNWSKFSIWGLYWPFSMLWTLIDDPIKRIFKFIIMNVFGGILQFFTNRVTSGVEKELNK